MHLRRPRLADCLRAFWSAASTRSDNLIQRLNISSSAVGASQKFGARQKAITLATAGAKKKGRLVFSGLGIASVKTSPTSSDPKLRTPVEMGLCYRPGRLCTIGYIV